MLEKVLNKKALIWTVLFAVLFGGIFSYLKIGKLEDAEIPIKTAMVITVYPGATAHEVELEVTDVLEKAIQKLENVKEIVSVSEPGLSKITVNIQDAVKTPQLPQLWDHLRRKVHDAKGSLPSGAYEPIVNDDFADVYGMLYAISAEGFSLQELTEYTEFIQKELLEIKGVKRSQIFGKQRETVDIIFSPEKLASLNINPLYIAMAMQNQSQIVNPGSITIGKEAVRVGVGNKIGSIQEVEDLLIQVPNGGNFRLGDIATIKRSVLEPKTEALYYNGKQALTLGLSNESGINVVKLGEKVAKRIDELKAQLPVGLEVHEVYSQPDRVDAAVGNFMLNLVESVAIVIIVLLFSMGLRSGLLISSGLVFTILGTLIVMLGIGLPLHRVSLGAIILAMGMLVDNSIVVADGILVDLKKKMDRRKAFINTAKQTGMPLLGATLVAILAFMPLALSPNMAGEFLSSLFTVLIISLLLSWVFAMVQTPFMATYFYRKQRPEGEKTESYDKGFYKYFRNGVSWALKHKGSFLIGSIAVLFFSFYAFRFISVDFMPNIAYDQFIVEYKLPQGSDIKKVEEDALKLQEYIQNIEGVKFATTSVGRPPARYTLMRQLSTGGQNYAEVIVETEEIEQVNEIIPEIKQHLAENYPDADARILRVGGAFSDYHVEFEFSGPDPQVLRQLSEQAKSILKADPTFEIVTDNWKNPTKKLTPKYSVDRAQKLGLSRKDMANSILIATTGMPIGAYYEGDKMIPVVLKTDQDIAKNMEGLLSIPVWGQQSRFSVPLNQIADTIALKWEDELVNRFNGKRAIKVQANVIDGVTAAQGEGKIKAQIDALDLPDGYTLRWCGVTSKSADANEALFMFFPLAVGLMLIIIIALFNNLKQTLIIFIVVPFAFMGISLGFNVVPINFGFTGVIGSLGLIGMMIKNSVVLLDEVNLGLKKGKSQLKATIDAAISRMRPVMMASLTTILGMLPLITDPMFNGMAVTIMFGLFVGSVVTLMVVPVLYAVFFKVDVSELKVNNND
jgi:multidrug efflux pump subunit AcrB